MPGKMTRSDPRPSVRVTRGAGSGQHLASVFQEGRETRTLMRSRRALLTHRAPPSGFGVEAMQRLRVQWFGIHLENLGLRHLERSMARVSNTELTGYKGDILTTTKVTFTVSNNLHINVQSEGWPGEP